MFFYFLETGQSFDLKFGAGVFLYSDSHRAKIIIDFSNCGILGAVFGMFISSSS